MRFVCRTYISKECTYKAWMESSLVSIVLGFDCALENLLKILHNLEDENNSERYLIYSCFIHNNKIKWNKKKENAFEYHFVWRWKFNVALEWIH